jgi:uncharacterized membrane protein
MVSGARRTACGTAAWRGAAGDTGVEVGVIGTPARCKQFACTQAAAELSLQPALISRQAQVTRAFALGWALCATGRPLPRTRLAICCSAGRLGRRVRAAHVLAQPGTWVLAQRSVTLPADAGDAVRVSGFWQPVPTQVRKCAARHRHVVRRRLECAWVQHRAAIQVDAPRELVFAHYRDLDAMPRWSPWLRSVRVDARDPQLTHWTLAAKGLEFTWQARMVRVEPPTEIAWESVRGLRNRGRVAFREHTNKSSSSSSSSSSLSSSSVPSTMLEIELAFELPAWVALWLKSAPLLQGFVERTLLADLERFRAYVHEQVAQERRLEAS